MKRPAKPFGLRDQNQEITRLHAGDEIWFDPSNGRVALMRSDKSLATGEQRLCDGTHLDYCEALINLDRSSETSPVQAIRPILELLAASHGLRLVSSPQELVNKNRIIFRLE